MRLTGEQWAILQLADPMKIKGAILTYRGFDDTISVSSSRRASACMRTSAAHFFVSGGLL